MAGCEFLTNRAVLYLNSFVIFTKFVLHFASSTIGKYRLENYLKAHHFSLDIKYILSLYVCQYMIVCGICPEDNQRKIFSDEQQIKENVD